jgi:UDP-N-acetylmuramoylalanine--D-glutamate ligase
MELAGRKIAVLGLGPDGIQMVRSLAQANACVTGFGAIGENGARKIQQQLDQGSAEIEWKDVAENAFLDFDMIIDTPGGKNYHAARDAALHLGVPVLTDFDLARQFMTAPIIAVTGSSGKTTTVQLIDQMLTPQGYKTICLGGDFSRWADLINDQNHYDYYLLELSSRRLEVSQPFAPHIAVFLNLYPAHFERHRTFVDYAQAKARIFTSQNDHDFLIYDGCAENLQEVIQRNSAKANQIRFSLKGELHPPCVYLENKNLIWINSNGERVVFNLPEAYTLAPLVMDAMASIAIAKICIVDNVHIQSVLDQPKELPFRLRVVRSFDGVTFIDDAAATNLGATFWAISSFKESVIWIAGGNVPKAFSFEIPAFLRAKLKVVIGTRSLKNKLPQDLFDSIKIIQADSIYEAVNVAYEQSRAGDIVLYSPGFPPDLYVEGSIKNRAAEFLKAVEMLTE